MKKLLNIITKVLLGIIFLYAFFFFAIGWVQGIYRPLIVSCIILFTLVIAALLFIIKEEKELGSIKKENESLLKKEVRYTDRIKHLELDIAKLNKTKEENTSEFASRQKAENTFSATIEQTEQLEPEVPPVEDTQSKNNESQPTTTIVEFEEEYYSSPNSNGEFDRGHAKKKMTDDSFYKVVWKPSEAKGKLELLNKRDYSRLLGGFKSDCLYPVCEVANNKNDGNIITMLSSGSVVLHDNKWIIDNGQKIKINIE